MTPDFKRLCEAAEDVLRGYEVSDEVLPADGTEAIVRAVLMALREPSDAMAAVADDYVVSGSDGQLELKGFTAMIDAILAEPANA